MLTLPLAAMVEPAAVLLWLAWVLVLHMACTMPLALCASRKTPELIADCAHPMGAGDQFGLKI